IETSRDDPRRRPRRPAVVSNRTEDSGTDERAFLSQSKVAKCDDRVAVAPGGDALLVEKVADAAEVAAAGGDANRCPRPAAITGVGNQNVRVQRVRRPDVSEAERGVVRVTGRVERNGRIPGGLIGRSEQDWELGPAPATVEGHMRARANRFGHVSAGIETKLVIVRAADHVVFIGRVDRDRRLVAGTLLLTVGVDVRARLERRRTDEIP